MCTASAGRTQFRCVTGWLDRMDWIAAGSSGWPGLPASAGCRRSNGMGGGGGVVLATTCRFTTDAGGWATPPEAPAERPSTLSRCGATGAVFITCPCWI